MSHKIKDLKHQKTYTSTNYNKGKRIPELITDDCLFEIFERTADKYSENIAVSTPAKDYTYCELEKGTNKMAWFLKNKGIRKGERIAIFLKNPVDIYVSMLAIMKAGACYVPIDENCPEERIKHILEICEVGYVITGSGIQDLFNKYNSEIILIDKAKFEIKEMPSSRLSREATGVNSDDLCYIICTSGSTGSEKGVLIEHRSAAHLVKVSQMFYGIRQDDRVYQGFTTAFDASVEEIWMAFGNGATLVPSTKKMKQAGPELPKYLKKCEITVLSCVPTLLSMFNGDIPGLRILILGGEVCPQHIVKTWSKVGRRIFNTYGPTEATVITTYAELSINRRVNIGRPLPNYDVYIMKSDGSFAKKDEEGELLIGGEGLARGYAGHSELTKEKFVWKIPPGENKVMRLYRSGDLVKFNKRGEIEFLGRIDSQIKLRGYRVELSEIESVLNGVDEISSSVVSLFNQEDGVQYLAAYIVLNPGRTKIDIEKIKRALSLKLPRYMIPQYIEFIESIPVLTSGKADRSALPLPTVKLSSSKKAIAPRNDLEKKIADVWGKVFKINNQKPDKISVKDHFFNDLGGHSLLAAKAVSALREQKEMNSMDFSDIYEYPTIELLARKVEERRVLRLEIGEETNRDREGEFLKSSGLKHKLCGIVQSIVFYKMHFLLSLPLAGLFYIMYMIYSNTLNLSTSSTWVVIAMTIIMGSLPTLLLMSIAAKWLIIGRFKPGIYPLWGQYYIRWWIVRALHNLFPVFTLCGTPFMSLYLRLMGAKVGRDCHVATHHTFCYDMLEIGEQTSIGLDSQLLGYVVEDGYLKIGKVKVGDRCYVGTSAILCNDTTMENGSMILEQSMLTQGSTIPEMESWLGSPAKNDIVLDGDIVELKAKNTGYISRKRKLAYGIGQMIAFSILGLATLFVFAPVALIVIALMYFTYDAYDEFILLLSPILAVVSILAGCAEMIIIKRILIGKVKSGVYDIYSFFHLKKWVVDQMMYASLSIFHTLYATLYTPIFLKMMGAKLGKNVEISTVSHISPDLLNIGDQCFFADASMAGTPKVYMGSVKIAEVETGAKTFIGNSALLPINSHIGSNCLIGVMSVPPRGDRTKNKTSWLGTPAIFLPKRLVNNDFSENETYAPKQNMVIKRLSIEFFRVILPGTIGSFTFMAILFILGYMGAYSSFWKLAFLLPTLWIASEFFALFIVLAFKWVLIRRYKPIVKPLWSTFVWRTEFITGLFEAKNVPMFLDFLRGTPFLPMILRLFGCKIGKKVFLDTTFFSEFDLVDIQDEVAINHNATLQTHLFEDRVMKMSHLKIEKQCSIGNGSFILYDTVMREGARLGSLSLLMKGESLPSWTSWEGNPAKKAFIK